MRPPSVGVIGMLTMTLVLSAGCYAPGDGVFGPVADVAGSDGERSGPPAVSWRAGPARGAWPLDVGFSVKASDPDGEPVRWTIDFGDGSAPANGSAVPATVRHTYTKPGAFAATVTVVDADGEATTASLSIVALATDPLDRLEEAPEQGPEPAEEGYAPSGSGGRHRGSSTSSTGPTHQPTSSSSSSSGPGSTTTSQGPTTSEAPDEDEGDGEGEGGDGEGAGDDESHDDEAGEGDDGGDGEGGGDGEPSASETSSTTGDSGSSSSTSSSEPTPSETTSESESPTPTSTSSETSSPTSSETETSTGEPTSSESETQTSDPPM